MFKSMVRIHILILGLSLTATLPVLAQSSESAVSVEQARATLAWSNGSTRGALIREASAYLAGGTGNYVTIRPENSSGGGSANKASFQPMHRSLPDQFAHVFGGIPDPELVLAGGDRLFAACEPHNCGLKAFIVTDATGKLIQAAGLIHHRCASNDGNSPAAIARRESAVPPCQHSPTLTIFYANLLARKPTLTKQIVQWAREKVAADRSARQLTAEIKFLH